MSIKSPQVRPFVPPRTCGRVYGRSSGRPGAGDARGCRRRRCDQQKATTLGKVEVQDTVDDYVASPKFTQPCRTPRRPSRSSTRNSLPSRGATTLTEALRNSAGVGTFYAGENGTTSTATPSTCVVSTLPTASSSTASVTLGRSPAMCSTSNPSKSRRARPARQWTQRSHRGNQHRYQAALPAGCVVRERFGRRRWPEALHCRLEPDHQHPAGQCAAPEHGVAGQRRARTRPRQQQALGHRAVRGLRPGWHDSRLPGPAVRQAGQHTGRFRADHRPAALDAADGTVAAGRPSRGHGQLLRHPR